MLVVVVAVGLYMVIQALGRIEFALQAINLHLDAIKKNANASDGEVIALLKSRLHDS